MADFQQFTMPVVLHHALIDAVPKETNGDMDFNFAVDGVHAGSETIKGTGLAVRGKLLPLRIFPLPAQAGSLVQVATTKGCEMVRCEIISAPVSSHRVVKELSEAQITYKGTVTLQFYFDGNKIGSDRVFTSATWKTEKFYLPSGSRGYIFQWKQVENADASPRGYVGSLETDIQPQDIEQPRVPS
ncbi:MAG: hypothetical protein QF535_13935 [Anaerolineales bacterium]|jgi:hypothetical protein|nr:hypothetical protein [Anaerolineales bacterium]